MVDNLKAGSSLDDPAFLFIDHPICKQNLIGFSCYDCVVFVSFLQKLGTTDSSFPQRRIAVNLGLSALI
jgi:hypothetical protein